MAAAGTERFLALVVVIAAVIDVLCPGINVAIIYCLPLVLSARRCKREALLRWTAGLVVLTYVLFFAKYFLLPHIHAIHLFAVETPLNTRLLNRTLVAVTICGIGGLLYFWIGLQSKLARRPVHPESCDPDETVYAQIVQSVEQLIASFMCIILTSCIAITDFLSPAQVNLPILYAIPLVVCFWTRSRKLLWVMLPVALGLSLAGYWFGPPPPGERAFLMQFMTNRLLAAGGLVALTVVFHFWMASVPSRQAAASPSALPQGA